MNEDRLLEVLDRLEEQSRQQLVALARLEEQIKAVPELKQRVIDLERWKYGLPIAGLTAVISAAVSAWTAIGGGS